mmetsp:Transcript_19202/g.25314  ORF Transcript_19202/g.25314 Transcript_19202/m.25314 type:complete len:88 (+) Transcript_19202:670-933(+)
MATCHCSGLSHVWTLVACAKLESSTGAFLTNMIELCEHDISNTKSTTFTTVLCQPLLILKVENSPKLEEKITELPLRGHRAGCLSAS